MQRIGPGGAGRGCDNKKTAPEARFLAASGAPAQPWRALKRGFDLLMT